MNRFIKKLLVITIIFILICLSGCAKSEVDYKSAISEHLYSEHGVSIESYETFSIDKNGGASAEVNITTEIKSGITISMRVQLNVDKEGNITSCSWCDLGIA